MTFFCNKLPAIPGATGLFFVLLVFAQMACSEVSESDIDFTGPLQPLIYTEYPDLTPDGAAVRERRLIRQLLEGGSDGEWGSLEKVNVPEWDDFTDPETLGELIVEALVGRDENLWEHLFVSAEPYAELVGVGESEAREFVDNQMGESLTTWDLFAADHSSEMPDGGLKGQLAFKEIDLGEARDIHGAVVNDESEAVQYWHNRVLFEHIDTKVVFTLRIPRIFRLPQLSEDDEDDVEREVEELSPVYRVASPIEADSMVGAFLDLGLHLKPQLLRENEYPFPLGLGSFWRYRRFDADDGVTDADPLARRFDEQPEGISADQVIVEVRDVSRYGAIRLVELLRSYDDRRHTRVREWWVLTPRRIYTCNRSCRQNIEDVPWLIGYFERETPILKFPLRLGEQWSTAGRSVDEQGTFVIDDDWHQIETPAGSFAGTYRIYGTGPLQQWDRYLKDVELIRDFAPGRGIVRRELRTSQTSEEQVVVIEELVESRLMF